MLQRSDPYLNLSHEYAEENLYMHFTKD